MLRTGVTSCLPTLITAAEDRLHERLANLDRAVAESRLGPLMVPGFHLEGPFLNPAAGYAGCHPSEAMVPPDPALLQRLCRDLERPVLLLTVAPERDGALDLITWACSRGMRVAMGHTAALAPDVERACEAGVCLSTHLGNALPQPQPKFANPLMAQLAEDRLFASFIADGIHIPRMALKVMLRAKTLARSVLVTDATAAAGVPPGLYRFAGMTIDKTEDGSVRVPNRPMLAGSALCLDQAVRNLVAWGLASAAEALAAASDTPASLLADAFAHHAIALPAGTVRWSADLYPAEIAVGDIRITTV
jgi:N-acetylglucosamine-6-phosphate deacetylase